MRKRLEKRKMNRDRKISGRKSVTNIKRQGREKQRRAEIEREARKKKKTNETRGERWWEGRRGLLAENMAGVL